MKQLLSAAFAASTLALSSFAFAQDAQAIVGDPAPDFTLTNTEGTEVSLSDYEGKIVVLEWINFECPFVGNQYSSGNMPRLQEQYASGNGDNDVAWLTINSAAEGKQGYLSNQDFADRAEQEGWTGTMLLQDHSGDVGRLYGALTTPHMFVIDSDGSLAYGGAIDSVPSTDPDALKGAENYVSAAIDALQAGKEVTTAETEPYGCGIKY